MQAERNRNTFTNLSDSKSSQRLAFERHFYIHKCQSRTNHLEYVRKKKNVQLSHRKTVTHWNLLFVFSWRSFRDQSLCLRPWCQRTPSMTSPIHAASSPRISRALSRHIPQQREMPPVIIHQNEPFMAHQKTMNCQSERSVCNMK